MGRMYLRKLTLNRMNESMNEMKNETQSSRYPIRLLVLGCCRNMNLICYLLNYRHEVCVRMVSALEVQRIRVS